MTQKETVSQHQSKTGRIKRWIVVVISFVGVGGAISLAKFYIDMKDRKDAEYRRSLQRYEKALAEWEAFSPSAMSSGTITIRTHKHVDLEQGRVTSSDSAKRADLFFTGSGYWDSGPPRRFVSSEYMRALNGSSWYDRGQISLDKVSYRALRDAKYATQRHPKSNYPDLFHGLPDDSPVNHVFFIKTAKGNVTKFRIMSYGTEQFQGG
ncbi:MAG: hypothetical protein AAGJ86_13390, partial [Pseudomonadota bacterium]